MLCTQGAWPKRLITISGSVHVRIEQTNLELIHHSHQPEDYCMTLVHHYSLEKKRDARISSLTTSVESQIAVYQSGFNIFYLHSPSEH